MKKFTLDDYRRALDGAGPKLKENILERAVKEGGFDVQEIKQLVDYAYPEPV